MSRGNRTSRRGRKLRRDIHLTDEARVKLRHVWTLRSVYEPGVTEDSIVNSLILAMPDPDEAYQDWQEEVL